MDENLTRGYCQLRMDSAAPRVEIRSGPSDPTRGGRSDISREDTLPPLDRCSCIYLALILCGAGFLLPYNSFITAVDYYQDKYPGSTIIFDMSLTYICVAFGGVIVNNLLVEIFSLHARITFGYVLSFLMLLAIALCDIWFDMFSKEVSYRLTLVAVGTVALGCTVQQSSFYGYTSMLPSRYTQAVMTGESAAGLIVSINRILTKSLLKDVRTNTIIFFIVSIATVWVCCIVFHLIRRAEFVRFYISICRNAGIADDQRGIAHHVTNPEEVDILDGNVTRDNGYGVLVLQSPSSPVGHTDRHFADDTSSVKYTHAQPSAAAVTFDQEQQVKGQGSAYRRHLTRWDAIKAGVRSRRKVAKHAWPYMFSIGLAYFVTLCLFPGIESEVVSCRLHSWMPVILIAIFNLFDFIGKIIASIPYEWPKGRLVLCTFCRILIIPMLMLCATPRSDPVLKSEVWAMLFSLVLGLTNGYFGSVPMILAPSKVPDEQKELAGNIMTLSYSVGLTTGSVVAYLLDSWLGPHTALSPCSSLNSTFASTTYLNATAVAGVLEGPMSTTSLFLG